MILKATCHTVEQYVGAHVLYWTGHIGMTYVIEVMISDMTTLRNRMIYFGINGTPRIASTFAGPAIADLFYKHLDFPWAFGAFAIILVGCSAPAMGLMVWMSHRAKAQGLISSSRRENNRSILGSLKHYFIKFDVPGILLITAALALLLLPFSLVAYAPDGWKTGYIIAMLVLGVVLFPAFYLYEAYVAP
ncbi:hypothetical protein COL922a_014488, partial [Colletotrichum nupharicola]